jgi:hypothetical protein
MIVQPVAPQVEIESKVRKRFITFRLQALKSGAVVHEMMRLGVAVSARSSTWSDEVLIRAKLGL